MTVEFEGTVEWDGKHLLASAHTKHGRVRCVVPRDTNNALPRYFDAISREIDLHQAEIFET